jgi:hypothetical protein
MKHSKILLKLLLFSITFLLNTSLYAGDDNNNCPGKLKSGYHITRGESA